MNVTKRMKSARISVFIALSFLLTGCGSDHAKSGMVPGLAAGNWTLTANSASSGTFYVGGNMSQSKSNIAGTMYVISSSCFDPSQPIAFSGTVKNGAVTLTSIADSNGQTISINATIVSASNMNGTYSIMGGNCANGDTGSLNANIVPTVTGIWAGPIQGSGGSDVTLSMSITQATTPSSDGSFALTGNLTYYNSACSVTGTITNSSIAGPYLLINGLTLEQDGSTGSIEYTSVLLNSPTNPTSMTGTYDVPDGLCAGDSDAPTFTKR